MNLREFLSTIRLYRKTFLAVALAVLALGIAWLVFVPLKYVSTTQLLVTINGNSTASAYQNDDVIANRVNSYVALLTSDVVNQRVVDKLGLKVSARDLASSISAVQVPKTALIDVAVTGSSPDGARRIAQAVGEEFVAYTAAIESPTGEDAQKVQTKVVSGASQPRSRIAETVVIGGLFVVLAALAGAVATWIRSATDRIVRLPRQAATATHLPVVGTVDPATAADSLATIDPYRRVRARLGDNGTQVIQLSPVDADVDTATIAANLATASTLAGHRTIVVDATGHEPHRHGVVHGGDGRPDVLSAGAWARDPDLVANPESTALIEQLKRDYQQVVIATQPAVSSPVASALSDHSDAVVLVVEPGQSRRADVRRVADDIRAVGGHLAGVLAAG